MEVIDGAIPYYAKLYKIPKAYEGTTKKEVDRLVDIGLLNSIKTSEWAAPCFVIPKKDGTVRFLTDYRGLNKVLKRKKHPLPLIDDIMISLESFAFATSLDLSMEYYAMILAMLSRKYTAIILPWGLYEYTALPMGLKVSANIFQAAMSGLFKDLPQVYVYIDDIIIIGSGSYEEHLKDVDKAISRLIEMGMQINPRKTVWAAEEVDYLGFTITRKGIKPQKNKVEAILKIKSPENPKQVRHFVGLVNFYKKFYKGKSKTLAPLYHLTKKGIKFDWTPECEKAFQEMKSIMAQDTLVSLPQYGQEFTVHTDANDEHIGGIISQDTGEKVRILAYFSKKFNKAQESYPVTEKELLSTVETLKTFRTMLLDQKITVYTDHLNLTHHNTQFTSNRVLRQRLVLEEYGVEIRYIQGVKNEAADALSRMPTEITDTVVEEALLNRRMYEDEINCPINTSKIKQAQQKDATLLNATRLKYLLKSYSVMKQFGLIKLREERKNL